MGTRESVNTCSTTGSKVRNKSIVILFIRLHWLGYIGGSLLTIFKWLENNNLVSNPEHEHWTND